MKYIETHTRSITKTVIYRILVVISDLIVIYILTKKIVVTLAITIFTNIASTLSYFIHERFWNAINWGKQRVR